MIKLRDAFWVALTASLLLVMGAGEALAQATTTTTTTIDLNLKPWIDLAFDFVKIIALALAGAIAAYIGRKFGQRVSAETQERIKGGIFNLLQAGLQRAQAGMSTENIEHPQVQKTILTSALKYAVDNGPAMLKRAGIDISTPDGQREVAEKLESMLAPAVMVAASAKEPVSVATAATIVNPAVPIPPPVIVAPVPVPPDGAPPPSPAPAVTSVTANAAPPK